MISTTIHRAPLLLVIIAAVLLHAPAQADELGHVLGLALTSDDECLVRSDPASCALSALQLRGQAVQAAKGKDPEQSDGLGVMNPTTPCAGDADLPAGPACYVGSLAVEQFTVSVKSFQAGKGVADLVATGALAGSVLGAEFTKSGQTIRVKGLDAAFEGKVRISAVEYCSSADEIRVSVAEPIEVVVALTRAECSKQSLVEREGPSAQRAQEPRPGQAPVSAQMEVRVGECSADTGTFCSGSCSEALGPATCVNGVCQCPAGWCFAMGSCFPTQAARSILTGGTCRIFSCSQSRGQTICDHGRCLCRVGHFSHNGACYPVLDTGGSCKVLPCQRSLGPTDCVQSRCLCQSGYAAANGKCERLPG